MNIEQFSPKTKKRIAKLLEDLAEAERAGVNIGTVISDAALACRRQSRRQMAMPEGFETVQLVQSAGPTIEFQGRLLAEQHFDAPDGEAISLELFETIEGAYVASRTHAYPSSTHRMDKRAVAIIDPGEDEQARRDAVMEHLGWISRARSMVKPLDWHFTRMVD